MKKQITLTGRVIPASERTPELLDDMFELMDRYFFVDRASFEADLGKKDWIILLEDEKRRLHGFTSLTLIKTRFEGSQVQALYSGDTIIDRQCWGSLELPRVWGKFMLEAIRQAEGTPLYWFLLSSGYKTYRFLPVFFKDYFPRYDGELPTQMGKLLNHLGTSRFGGAFDAKTGLVTLSHPTPLKGGVAEVNRERLKDPVVEYFVQRNPDHQKGIELACLAPLNIENLRPFIRRTLKV